MGSFGLLCFVLCLFVLSYFVAIHMHIIHIIVHRQTKRNRYCICKVPYPVIEYIFFLLLPKHSATFRLVM